MNANKIKTALLGFGPGGRIYNAPILSAVKGFEVTKILTSNPANIKAAEKDFPQAGVTGDLSEVLKDHEVELVVVSAPNHLHTEITEKALRAGKHVVVEKPFTPSVKEADQLIALARQQDRVLSINHNRRWDSDIQTIKSLLEQDRLGAPVEFEAHFDRFRPLVKKGWKEEADVPGSGILYDLGSHLIDQALMLFGLPDKVFGHLRVQRENSRVTDNFELLLLYPHLKATLKAGMLVGAPGPRFQVLGRRGSFVKYGTDVQEAALKEGLQPGENKNWGEEPPETWGKLYSTDKETLVPSVPGDYRKFYQNIHNAIREGAALEVKPEQAREVVRVIELAIRSHREGQVLDYPST